MTKRLVSVLLTFAMLTGMLAISASSANDTCIRCNNNGIVYSAGSDEINSYILENGGGTLIFDVLVESVETPSSGKYAQLTVFSNGPEYNYAGFNFTKGAFTVGSGSEWPTNNQTDTFLCYAEKSFEWQMSHWYEIAFQFDGPEVTVYLDGIPMVSAEVESTFESKYLILYPQHCTFLMDNLRVCGKSYNVRERYGDVIATEDFTGITAISDVSSWYFGDGYSVANEGRPMPELCEMLPNRTVSPSVSDGYLKFTENGKTGVARIATDFTEYGGFTYVEDIRIDRKSVNACFGVRFGGGYIAGYDWDTGKFYITSRSGYGFNTSSSAVLASAEYALELGKTYEFAVRQAKSIVSVYLNGVLMLRAINDKFDTGYDGIEVNHYRLGSAIDNAVVAYSDYNVREAEGSAVARLSFDENKAYINGIIGFDLGNTGYSIGTSAVSPKAIVGDAVAESGSASVGISLSGALGYSGFELRVSYPSGFAVKSAEISSALKGAGSCSQLSANPLIFAFASSDDIVGDTELALIEFTVPESSGEYQIEATLVPYIDDIAAATLEGTGTVSVPKPEVTGGLPSGVTYDGVTVSWDSYSEASAYEICVIYDSDGYESIIDSTEDCEYEMVFDDYVGESGVFYIVVSALDGGGNTISCSDRFTVISETDGRLFCGLPAYADELNARLAAHIAENEYSDANRAKADAILAEAEEELGLASDYATMLREYNEYITALDSVPTGAEETYAAGDVNGDGTINSNDFSALIMIVSGNGTKYEGNSDVNSDGVINSNDIKSFMQMLSGK